MCEQAILFIGADYEINADVISHIAEELAFPIQNYFEYKPRKKKPRNDNYYEVTIPKYNNDLFQEHFRMSRSTFESLITVIVRKILDPISKVDIEKKVLFTIWVLAKPESFLAAGDRFGLAKSTGHGIFTEVTTVIAGLMLEYIIWPDMHKYSTISDVFYKRSRGFPGIIGAIDGCHIPIKQPVNNSTDYYNRKGFHSIVLQGTCDHKGRFIDCLIGMPGRMHDARIFRNSPLYNLLTANDNPLLPERYHLIGDSAYPLLKNLMTPFRDNGHLTVGQTTYNISLSSVRSIIERTFGILKGKFRRLKQLDISDLQLANKVIAATCVLHNFIIDHTEVDMQENFDTVVVNESNDYNQVQQLVTVNREAAEKRQRIVTLLE